MKRSRVTVVLATLALAAAAVLSACGGDDEPGLTETTLRLTEGKTTETPAFDAEPKGQITAGDRLVSSKELFDSSGEERVGSVYLDCTAAAGTEAVALCSGMLELEEGGLAFTETFDPSANEEHIATVNGGTGEYAGATGELIAGVDGTREYELRLFLPDA